MRVVFSGKCKIFVFFSSNLVAYLLQEVRVRRLSVMVDASFELEAKRCAYKLGVKTAENGLIRN